MKENYINRLGEKAINNQGLKMWIKEYRNCDDIDVIFEDKTIVKNKQYSKFKNGSIKNPNFCTVYNIGYIGIGKYKPIKDNKGTKEYITWCSMLQRCYSKHYHKKQPTYIDCIVCPEWHNFQNFAEWFNENYYEIEGERMCLDKDILIKRNKIYSPDTCLIVPQSINSLFVRRQNDRSKYYIGVHFNKKIKKYVAICSLGKGKIKDLGYYDTPEEAFECYKEAKENEIKRIADLYKDKIPQILYEAMYSYQVEITD